MQEFGSVLDRDWLVFDFDPCVCHLSRYCLLFILTASPAEKTRLSTTKNNVCGFKDGAIYCLVNYFKMYVHKSDFFSFFKTFKYRRIDTCVPEF